MKTPCAFHEPPPERGCVEDQPQRTSMFVSVAAGAPSPRAQTRSVCQPVHRLDACEKIRTRAIHDPFHQSINPLFILFPFLFALIPLTGCVSKATADAEAKAAFLAGENAAYQIMQSSQTAIIVLGNVQKHQIKWVAGLTLAQAIASADYKGAHDPTEIILKRNSVQTEIDPKQLLNGEVVPLQPGDVVSILSQ